MIDQKDDQRIDEEIYTHSPLPLRISVSSDVINQEKPQSTKFSMFAFAFSIGATCYILFLIGYLIYLKQQIYPIRNANNLHRYTEISEISQFIDENDSKCEKEWKFLQDEDIGFCYRAWHSPGISYSIAKMLCRSHNGNVISIRSLDEDVFVQKVALEMPSITKIWIGLEMLWGHRNWLDLTVEKPAQTAILNVNRPEGKVSAFEDYPDKPNTAKCIRCKQTKMNGLWYFVGLNESLNETYRPDGVVCKKRIRRPPIKYTIKSNESCDIGWAHNEHTGFCYYLQNYADTFLTNTPLYTWAQAEENCRKQGAHLVSIHSKVEREFVKDMISSNLRPRLKVPESDAGCGAYHNVWIGIHQVNGTAVNVDGSVNRFWVPPFEPGKSNQWWMMCNDISNTYVESILPHNEHGVLTRYVCKKVVNNL